jgi:hypothetical protein
MRLRNVPKEPVLVVQLQQGDEFVMRVCAQISDMGARIGVAIDLRERWEAIKCVKAIYAPREILRLENGAQLDPRHETESAEHAALNDAPLNWENALIQLVHGEESLEMLASDIARERLDLLLD